jgi:hypothetical protein
VADSDDLWMAARDVDNRAPRPTPREPGMPSRVHSLCAPQMSGVTSRARVIDLLRPRPGQPERRSGGPVATGPAADADARAVPPAGAPQPTARARSGGRAPNERCHRPWPSSP